MNKSKSNKTKPLQRVPTVIAIGIAIIMMMFISGCGKWVLRANFNEYDLNPSGQQLVGDIKGKPDGDRIAMNITCVDVKVLNGDPNSLRIQNCTSGVEIIPSDHDSPAEYFIDWEGTRKFPQNTLLTFISFRGEGQGFTLRFLTGKLDILVGGEPDVGSIDVSSFSSHDIRLEIKIGENAAVDFFYQEKFSDGTKGPNITRSFSLSNFTKLTEIVISAEEFAAYTISDLDVFAK